MWQQLTLISCHEALTYVLSLLFGKTTSPLGTSSTQLVHHTSPASQGWDHVMESYWIWKFKTCEIVLKRTTYGNLAGPRNYARKCF